ncbi:MAG: TRAP transporter substrate-binding protein [Rectinemataceae bacterium]|nr:TRAP transporter substrate-binding protein [Rectinemataceae bacterium]
MRRFITLLLVLALVAPVVFGAGAEKSFNLKLAGIKTPTDPASLAMEKFAELVGKNAAANITVKTFNNSVLGPINDMLSGMPTGITDLFYNTLSCYSWLGGAKVFNAVSAPFIWDNYSQLQAFLDSDVGQAWFEEAAAKTGVRVLAATGELPPRELTSNKAVRSAADFVGLKVRTAESALVQQTMRKLGATPVVVPFADLYLALRQGTVDAQENNFITVKTSSLFEVQKYFMKTDYIRDVSAIFISENVWKQMSPAQRTIVKDAAVQACKFEAEQIAAQMNATMEFLGKNMTYIDVDVKSIQDKLGANIYQEFDKAGQLWPTGTVDKIFQFKANYKK